VGGGDEKVREAEEEGSLVGFRIWKLLAGFQGPVAEPPGGARDSADRTGGVFG
jgi:hypothetical protein